MSTTIELRVEQSLIEGGLYRVKMDVLYAAGIAPRIFVFKTVCGTYSHVATPYDMENIPDTTAEAADLSGNNYFRMLEVVQDFTTVETAEEYSAYTRGRVAFLAEEYPKAISSFEGTNDYTYTG